MEYRKFGPTDLTVSVLGFGCYKYAGGEYGDKMAAAIRSAIDQGVTCFDTAPHYGPTRSGESELLLGRTLGPRRKDVVVVTKCGLGWQGSQLDRPKGRDGRRESILPLVDQSLQRMRTDYIDVLLVHAPDVNAPFDETMGALDSVVQQGKVRYVGVSNFTLDQIKECEATRRIEVVQFDYNMFDRRVEQEVYPYCEQHDIGVMTYGSMGFGLLAGTYTMDTRFPDNDYRGRGGSAGWDGGMLALEQRQRNLQVVEDLKAVAAKRGKTMPQLALRWILDHPAVSVALVGTLNVEELHENLGVLDWALSGEDLKEIDVVFARYGVDTHPAISLDPE